MLDIRRYILDNFSHEICNHIIRNEGGLTASIISKVFGNWAQKSFI
jgi:hypothetical protein